MKNPKKRSCVDLILTNKRKTFQSTCLKETGLSGFHRMTVLYLTHIFESFNQELYAEEIFLIIKNAFITLLNEIYLEEENAEFLLEDPNFFYKVCTRVLKVSQRENSPQKNSSTYEKYEYEHLSLVSVL